MKEAVTFLLQMVSLQPRPWSQFLSTSRENFLHQLPPFYASSILSLKYFPIRKVNIIQSLPSLLKRITHPHLFLFSISQLSFSEGMSIPWTILLSSLQTGLTPHHSSDSVSPKAISQKWTDTVLGTINFVFSLSIRLPWGHFFWFLHTSLGLLFSSLQGNHFFCLYLRYRGPLQCHSQSSALLLPLPHRFLLLSSLQLYFKYVNDNQIFVA